MKRVRFWGTRGSLPVALTAAAVRQKVLTALRGAAGRVFASDADLEGYVDGLAFPVAGTYGGHTSCVELETGGPDYVICDLGSGVRPFGQAALARHGPASPQTYHIFMSHVHWDHIMGLPFFTPAYIPGNRVRIYGCHPWLESALRRQQDEPSFPVDFSFLRADIEFVHLEPGKPHAVAGMTVTTMLQRHAGDSYGYRFDANGRSVVYTTDSEHQVADLMESSETDRYVSFFRDADLVIFDAMYSLADAVSIRADWGHSSNVVGVELCQAAGARHLCLFHHEPANDDQTIDGVLADTRRLEQITRTGKALTITAAYDGMEIAL
jgi:phosphoribosyl 1,2-cyclic phosphodiesterase